MVLWLLRYRLTLRDLSEMFLQRGIVFSYEAVREWEAKLALVLASDLRRKRWGKSGPRSRQWHVDETYLKVRGRWCYLYRAIDRDGNLVDSLLSEHCDMAAAQAFFRSAKSVTGMTPDQVTAFDVCEASRASRPPGGSVEAMMSFATTSALAPATSSMFPPAAVACFTFVAPLLRSQSWKLRSLNFSCSWYRQVWRER